MRTQLIFSFALIVLVSVIGMAIFASQGAATEVRAFMFQGGMVRAKEIASQLEAYYEQYGSFDGAENLLSSSGMEPGQGMGMRRGAGGPNMAGGMMQRLRLADATGKVIADSTAAPSGETLTQEQLALAIPLNSDQEIVGYLLPESAMAFTVTDERFLVSRLTRAALIAGLIAGSLALLLALFLAYRLMRPVRLLTQAAQQIASGNLSRRVKVKGKDELAQLAMTFNQMAEALETAQENRKAMTADIAHELRTPLAVQLANLEALQDGIYPLTTDSLQPILEQNRLLNRLVEDLRTLALADAGQLRLEPVTVNLPEQVSRLVESFLAQASAQNVQITLKIQDEIPTVLADPARLDQIVSNLLSNALRFTPAGGKIELTLKRAPGIINLVIHDSGPGIPAEALPKVFERFYRADHSRSREEGGSGLGLAIARQLAEIHGGSLTAANHPEGGAVFTLTLPASQ